MLHRDLPFGLARHHAQAEPFFDQQSRPASTHVRQATGRSGSNITTSAPGTGTTLNGYALLPEDVLRIILGYLTVAELLVTRRVSSLRSTVVSLIEISLSSVVNVSGGSRKIDNYGLAFFRILATRPLPIRRLSKPCQSQLSRQWSVASLSCPVPGLLGQTTVPLSLFAAPTSYLCPTMSLSSPCRRWIPGWQSRRI